MSESSDLIQQMDRERQLSEDPAAAPHFRSSIAAENNNSRQNWASEEALRLVQQIFLLQTAKPPQVVVFAGIDHQSGCSHICAAVAETLARNAGRAVCLVEANFRSPSLANMFGTVNRAGLTESLLSNEPINEFVTPVTDDRLCLLTSGRIAADSTNLLTSERLGERLKELRGIFDVVIIDAPPLTRYSDAVVLGQLADGLVLVLEAGVTRREAASAAAVNLRSMKVAILAAVLNKRRFPIPEKIYGWL